MSQEGYFFFAAEVVDGLLVVKDVRFGLIDRGANFTEREQPFQLRRTDVAHAQSSHLTFPMQLLALLPHFVERDLVRLKLLAESHAAERRVNIDERLPLPHHRGHVGLVLFEALADVARRNAHLKRVGVAHHHEVGQVLVGELLGDEGAREGFIKTRHRRAGTGAIKHSHAVVVRYLMHARALVKMLVDPGAADADARQVAAAQVERVQERRDLFFDTSR